MHQVPACPVIIDPLFLKQTHRRLFLKLPYNEPSVWGARGKAMQHSALLR
ncbi:MAG: hypothetical protein RR138_07645 [Akkermansia sp.]